MKIDLYSTDGELQQKIEVWREQKSKEYNYRVVNITDGVEGFVGVKLRDKNWFEGERPGVISYLERFIGSCDVAEIKDFYPHRICRAKEIPRHRIRKGIGKSVLKAVLGDLQEQGAKGVYCCDPKPLFFKMLRKQGFMHLITMDRDYRDRNDHLLKKVG